MAVTSLARDNKPSIRNQVSAAEWQARVDLAAAHRYAALMGWSHLIFNHFTARVPGEPSNFLIKEHGLLFEEVTASNLVKLDMNGNIIGDQAQINAAGYTIHTAVLTARPEVNAVTHIHTTAGCVVAALKDGLKFYSQESTMFYNRVGYHDFEGVAEEPGERERLARDLGRHKVMILRHHGVLTCGTTTAEALYQLNELMSAMEVQAQLAASHLEATEVPGPIAEKAAQQFEKFASRHNYGHQWDAMVRMVERADPSYRD